MRNGYNIVLEYAYKSNAIALGLYFTVSVGLIGTKIAQWAIVYPSTCFFFGLICGALAFVDSEVAPEEERRENNLTHTDTMLFLWLLKSIKAIIGIPLIALSYILFFFGIFISILQFQIILGS